MNNTFDALVSEEKVNMTVKALKTNGFMPEVVDTKEKALARIKELIPGGASVMNGSSTTLKEIGFIDYLKAGQHGWNNLHEAVLLEKDPEKQALLRKQSVLSDVYLGSAHAITQEGEILIASASGSQMPHLVYTSQTLILVVGTQKIVPTLSEALSRLRGYVYPLEDARMKEVGMGGSVMSKLLTLKVEPSFMGRKFHVIFVKEKLGF